MTTETTIPTPADIAAMENRLAEMEARYAELHELILRLEKERRELGRWGDGKIHDMKIKIAQAKEEYETSLLPVVRVTRRNEKRDWRFVKMTPVGIYLRVGGWQNWWDLDGTSKYNGTIHPDDLTRILDGSIK